MSQRLCFNYYFFQFLFEISLAFDNVIFTIIFVIPFSLGFWHKELQVFHLMLIVLQVFRCQPSPLTSLYTFYWSSYLFILHCIPPKGKGIMSFVHCYIPRLNDKYRVKDSINYALNILLKNLQVTSTLVISKYAFPISYSLLNSKPTAQIV